LWDFGIAKRVPLPGARPEPSGEPLTEPGVRPGTRGYMSPEQLAGAEATAGSDLYAAALVIYEAYTARHWLEAQHLGRRAWSGIPGPEAHVLRRALAWRAEGRWPHAASFRRVLWPRRETRCNAPTLLLLIGRLARQTTDPAVITARGDTGHLEFVADTLAYGLVREIWNRENPLDLVLPRAALPQTGRGLAAWLAAERLLAQGRWGDADRAYDEA